MVGVLSPHAEGSDSITTETPHTYSKLRPYPAAEPEGIPSRQRADVDVGGKMYGSQVTREIKMITERLHVDDRVTRFKASPSPPFSSVCLSPAFWHCIRSVSINQFKMETARVTTVAEPKTEVKLSTYEAYH